MKITSDHNGKRPKSRGAKEVGREDVTTEATNPSFHSSSGRQAAEARYRKQENEMKKSKKVESRKAARPLKTAAGPAVTATGVGSSGGMDKVGSDGRVILQVRVRPEFKRELKARAFADGVNLQIYVMSKLMEAGLPVLPEDLLNLHKPGNRSRGNPAEKPTAQSQAGAPDLAQLAALGFDSGLLAQLGRAHRQASGPAPGNTVLNFNFYCRDPSP